MDSLEKAIDRVKSWSETRRNEAAELLFALDELEGDAVDVDDAALAVLDAALAAAEQGDVADAGDIEALFSRFRP